MSNRQAGLAALNQFVSEFLSSTGEVKRVLEAECEEARYVLKPWPIETIITKEIDESCCTCEAKSSLEDHVEEIVEGIGRALAQAQELREKIAMNVSKHKRKMREPSLQTIYMPASVSKTTKVSSNKDNNPKPQKSSSIKTSSSDVNGKTSKNVSGVNTGKSNFGRGNNNIEPKTITDKKLLRTSVGNIMSTKNSAKTTKNFVAANKSSIKHCKRFSKSTADLTSQPKKSIDSLSPLSGTSKSLSGCSASIAQLNSLMDRVSVGENKSGSGTSCTQSEDRNCPFHGENVQQFVQEKIRTTVDMIEGLDRFGVPADVVRILKLYNSYLNKELADEIPAARGQRAANKFLAEFNSMNEDRISKRETTDLMANLTIDFASLFRDSHDLPSASSSGETSSIFQRYAELDSRSKSCQLKKFDPVEFRKPKTSTNIKNDVPSRKGWASNGVWNSGVIRDGFPGMNRAHCIRYANKAQLLSFFEHNQRLQQLLYHRNLMELLSSKVIPEVLENFDPGSAEYCEAYKTIFTIAQVLNPRLAVLVRTDI